MIDTPYTILIEQLFKRLYSINWVADNVTSPLILFSRQFNMLYIFSLAGNNKFSFNFGSTATSYVTPKLTKQITGENIVTHQYLTDTVRGEPKTRTYNVNCNMDFLGEVGKWLENMLGELNSTLKFNIINSLDFIHTLEKRTSAGRTTTSDTYMVFSADGTFFEEAILKKGSFTVDFSNGVPANIEGIIDIQEITSYDIAAIFTDQGSVV